MKLIRKMRLINWHFFDDQVIDFDNINVISGENGSGKSTILDALNYFISGGTCKFNMAANALSSGRTIETYLKAKTGFEGKPFLRDSDNVIGHIAVDFYDDTNHKEIVIGLVVQLIPGGVRGPYYYKITGSSWNDALFFSDETEVNGFDELMSAGKKQGLDIKPIGVKNASNKARKRAVEDALGIPNEKYNALFGKAISFEPLGNISKFAMDFLLPREELDLSSIQGAILSYREIKRQVDSEKERAEELKPIVDAKDKYEDLQKKLFALDLLVLMGEKESEEQSIKKNTQKIQDAKRHIKEHTQNADIYGKRASEARQSAEQIRISDGYKLLSKLEEQEKGFQDKVASAHRNRCLFETKLRNEMSQASRIGTSLDLQRIIVSKDFENYLKVITDYSNRVNAIRSDAYDNRAKAIYRKETSLASKEEITNTIHNLEQDSYDFPDYVNQLKDNVRKAIETKTGDANPNIVPLSQLLSINDTDWTNAIEGLLDKRRFDLFLKKEYREIAKETFNKSPASLQDYFQVGVVAFDGAASDPEDDSLARKIDAFHVGADGKKTNLQEQRQYIDWLLGDVHCVSTSEDFVPGEKAITKDGVYFDGKTIRYVSKDAMNKPYIGRDSIKKRLKKAREDLEKIKSDIQEAEGVISRQEKLIDNCGKSLANDLSKDTVNYWKEEEVASDDLRDCQEKIDKVRQIGGSDLLELDRAIKGYEQRAAENDKKEKAEKDAVQECYKEIGGLEEANKSSQESIIEKEAEIRSRKENSELEFSDLDGFLDALSEGKKGDDLKQSASRSKGSVTESYNSAKKVIENAISNYCSKHPNELKNDIDNYKEFVKRYNKIIDDDLAKLNPELEEAWDRSKEELQSGFISKMRKSLKDAKADIDNLNRSLKLNPFGNGEIYTFEAKRTNDELLRKIYHIAMETNQDDSSSLTLFTKEFDDDSQAALNEVLELLARPEDDPEYKERREEVLDYRKYMTYDVKITMQDGNTMSYGKNEDSKSGGETQTPFYALIAGAFQSLIAVPERTGRSPCCIVAFDEAFNNMDGERIRQMLEFYRELRIQLIISIPSSRFSYIAPYADNLICLSRDGDTVALYRGTIEKEPKDNGKA